MSTHLSCLPNLCCWCAAAQHAWAYVHASGRSKGATPPPADIAMTSCHRGLKLAHPDFFIGTGAEPACEAAAA